VKKTPYDPCWTADQVLNGVDRWVDGCILVRETEAFPGQGNGRIDGLLVPVDWSAAIRRAKVRLGLIGVEVKITRTDFFRGLKSGQFERYDKALSGLYIATTMGVCKTREIPAACGHLIVNRRRGYGTVCVCRRHPRWKDGPLTVEDTWDILLKVVEHLRDEASRDQARYEEWKETIGHRVIAPVMTAISRLEIARPAERDAAEAAGEE